MQKTTYPEIDIQYGHFLAPFFNFYAQHSGEKDEPTSIEDVPITLERVEKQKNKWGLVEEKILSGIEDIFELKFKENYIPVYLVPINSGAFSDPIVISAKHRNFTDVLTHELIHRISYRNNRGINFTEILNKLFPEYADKKLIRNHIMVHAFHKHVFLNVLNDTEGLARDIEKSQPFDAYKTAWEIVERIGYQKIIDDIKNLY